MNEETMATKMQQLRLSEPVYAHLLGEFRTAESVNNSVTPERWLKQLREKIRKRGDVLEREASAHANDLRRLGKEARVAVLELAGYSVDEHTLVDFAGHTVAEFTTAVKVEA